MHRWVAVKAMTGVVGLTGNPPVHSLRPMTPISVRIEEVRKVKGWSQAELARRSGVSQSTISRLEAGSTPSIYLANLERLAAVLEVDPGYLLVNKGK